MNTTSDGFDPAPTFAALLQGKRLDRDGMRRLFEAMMTGLVQESQIASILTMLTMRDLDPEELTGAAEIMRRHVTPIPTTIDPDTMLDTAGTGGAPKTFNVSTAAAIVAAAAGIPVAKHGNRSRTGRGSAEVLQKLGVDIDASPDTQAACLEQVGTCFCFAIHHHPATRFVAPVRRALGFPTIFNLLGPLTNPGGARRQLLGVWDRRFGPLLAETLIRLGSIRAIVAHSDDGLDEISISAPTTLWHVEHGEIHEEHVCPEDAGLSTQPIESVTAGDLDEATRMILSILEGTEHGAPLDMVLMNAGGAMLAAGAVCSLSEGVQAAREVIEGGAAMETLSRLGDVSHLA
jgi:anthranilate phosphoribosyltransferase